MPDKPSKPRRPPGRLGLTSAVPDNVMKLRGRDTSRAARSGRSLKSRFAGRKPIKP